MKYKAFIIEHPDSNVEPRITKQHLQTLRHNTQLRIPGAVVAQVTEEELAQLRRPGHLFNVSPFGKSIIRLLDEANDQ
jgi:hypothetical protein